jgi:hypothetical protein
MYQGKCTKDQLQARIWAHSHAVSVGFARIELPVIENIAFGAMTASEVGNAYHSGGSDFKASI